MIPPLDLNAPGPMDAPEYGRRRCRQRAAVGGGGTGVPPPPPPTGPAAAEPSARRRAAGPVSPARRARPGNGRPGFSPATGGLPPIAAGVRCGRSGRRIWSPSSPPATSRAVVVARVRGGRHRVPPRRRDRQRVLVDRAHPGCPAGSVDRRPATCAHCWEATTRTFLERQRLPNVLPVDPGRVGVEQLADQAPRRRGARD